MSTTTIHQETPDPRPLLELLKNEDLLQLARVLDDQVQLLANHTTNEGTFYDLSTRVHVLHLLRDAFLKSAGKSWK